MRWRLLTGVVLGTAIAASAVVAIDFARFAFEPMDMPSDAEPVLHVERGTSIRRIARDLEHQGRIERSLYFRVLARVTDADKRIQAGEYFLTPDLTPYELQRKMVRGDVILHRFTIIEGWTFRQMMAAMQQHDAIESTLADVDPDEVMARLGQPDMHPEGWFYPDTYRFSRGTSDLTLLRRAHDRMNEVLEAEWANRADDAPVETPYEALILASIIERETGLADERKRVAGVFAERLDIGMRLQTDPTVIYGLGDDYTGRIRYRDLRTDTPYNTYTRAGLTPTPIAMPSQPAIHAALHPNRQGEFYFVATKEGGHVFSRTLDEHNQAVIKYQLDGDASRLRGYQE